MFLLEIDIGHYEQANIQKKVPPIKNIWESLYYIHYFLNVRYIKKIKSCFYVGKKIITSSEDKI